MSALLFPFFFFLTYQFKSIQALGPQLKRHITLDSACVKQSKVLSGRQRLSDQKNRSPISASTYHTAKDSDDILTEFSSHCTTRKSFTTYIHTYIYIYIYISNQKARSVRRECSNSQPQLRLHQEVYIPVKPFMDLPLHHGVFEPVFQVQNLIHKKSRTQKQHFTYSAFRAKKSINFRETCLMFK